MKKIILFITILPVLFSSCGQIMSIRQAMIYNDKLIDLQREIDGDFVIYLEKFDEVTLNELPETRKNLVTKIDEYKTKISGMKDFDKSSEFKDHMIELLDSYKKIIENEFAECEKILMKSDELTDQDYELFVSKYNKGMDEYDVALQKFSTFLEDFAKKWKFELEEID